MKVLFVEKKLLHYRIPFYACLSKRVDELTVCHSGKKVGLDGYNFREIILAQKSIGRFVFQPGLLKLARKYDVVITKFDISWLSMIFLSINPFRKYKVYHWGIGANCTNGWDKSQTFDFLRYFYAKRSNGIIFYSDKPIDKYVNVGHVNKDKLHVAHNTVDVSINDYEKGAGKYFLVVGTLYKKKNIDELIRAIKILQDDGLTAPLKIVGTGEYKSELEKLVRELEVKSIEFVGPKYGEELRNYFSHAIATISPNQAGLSVLESMAYGVPFITKEFVVTGGESFNIKNRENGILYSGNEFDLANVLKELLNNKELQENLSQNAFSHYHSHRRIDQMVDVFDNIINQNNSI